MGRARLACHLPQKASMLSDSQLKRPGDPSDSKQSQRSHVPTSHLLRTHERIHAQVLAPHVFHYNPHT